MLSCARYNVQACTQHCEVFLSLLQIPSALTPEMESEKDKRNTERKKAQKKAQKQRVKVHNGKKPDNLLVNHFTPKSWQSQNKTKLPNFISFCKILKKKKEIVPCESTRKARHFV